MNKDILKQMMEKFQSRLDTMKANNEIYSKVKEKEKCIIVQEYLSLYNEFKERNLHGNESEESILDDIYKTYIASLNDLKEDDTNKIYFLTRRDVHEMKCARDSFCYDDRARDGYIKYYGEVLSTSFGDIFTNLENSKYWYFIPKEYQVEFRENNKVVESSDCSLYYLAQKYFFENAIKYGEEEAVKRVLKRKF